MTQTGGGIDRSFDWLIERFIVWASSYGMGSFAAKNEATSLHVGNVGAGVIRLAQ